jgi:hypothetical protein
VGYFVGGFGCFLRFELYIKEYQLPIDLEN